METTTQEKKYIAVQYMKRLGMQKDRIDDFIKSNKIYCYDGFEGAVIEPDSELGKKVKSIEDDKHCLVYAVTHDYMIFGECYSLLLVSPYEEDWNYSLLAEDNSIFRVNAYVWNSTVEEHSEMGYVIIKTIKGNLGRIG